jgi:hypothetical protein
MTAKLAALFAALTIALNATAHVRVALWPGWLVPLPTLVVSAEALLVAWLAARLAVAVLARRGPLPYIAVAVIWREARS